MKRRLKKLVIATILAISALLFARCESLGDVKMCHCEVVYNSGNEYDCVCEHDEMPLEIFGTDKEGMNIILKECGD